jgi:hypothetical protein
MWDVAKGSGVTIERIAGIRQTVFATAFLVGPVVAGVALAVLPSFVPLAIIAFCWMTSRMPPFATS